MSLSREQLALRRTGITATEIAAIVGVHPYRSGIDVWLEKTGQAEPVHENERTRWGEILEEPIRTEYERLHNVRVELPGTLQVQSAPWQIATPDGIVYPHGARMPERGMEIKVHSRDAVYFGQLEYGAAGTDEVPPHELVQCMWGMNVTGLEVWDLIAFLDGAPVEYTILRDDDLIGTLVEAGERFLRDHVQANVPPEPDGSASYAAWQKRRWKGKPLKDDVLVLAIDDPLRDTIMQLREAREHVAENTKLAKKHAQVIKEVLGDRTVIQWHDERGKLSKIAWKRNRDGTDIDYEAAAKARRDRAALTLSAHRPALERALDLAIKFENDEVVAEVRDAIDETISTLATIASSAFENENTTTTEGARPFTVPRHWSKNENDKPKKGDSDE